MRNTEEPNSHRQTGEWWLPGSWCLRYRVSIGDDENYWIHLEMVKMANLMLLKMINLNLTNAYNLISINLLKSMMFSVLLRNTFTRQMNVLPPEFLFLRAPLFLEDVSFLCQ
jgi:hypothetical protein